jgi:hypothetical protein
MVSRVPTPDVLEQVSIKRNQHSNFVIPAKAGTQGGQYVACPRSRFRGDDGERMGSI